MKNEAKANYEAKFKAAMEADDAFQAAVVKQFGKKTAGTMRYLGSKHNAETKAASKLFHEAAAVMLDAKKALEVL